jgi:polysaccharide pyruvyl transferase WcaK-like protein
MNDCVLWGGYAGGNVGDELTLAVALRDMEKVYPGQVSILTPNVEYTQWLFPKTKVIEFKKFALKTGRNKTHLLPAKFWFIPSVINQYLIKIIEDRYLNSDLEWVKELKSARHLYLVGGGYLNDLFNMHAVLLPIRLASRLGVDISSAPVGIGPFRRKENADLTIDSLRSVALKVRDPESLDFCHQHGLVADLCKDDGFKIKNILDHDDFSTADNTNLSKKPLIGICVFYQHGSESSRSKYASWWVRFLAHLKKAGLENNLEGFCFHNDPNLDFYYMVQLFDKAGIDVKRITEPFMDYKNVIKKLRNYDYVITTRFHSAVVSRAYNIPFIAAYSGEYYGSKMHSTIGDNKDSFSIDIEKTDPIVMAEVVANDFNRIIRD